MLSQIRAIEDYRQLTLAQRRLVGGGRFAACGSVRGRSVLLIDDVVTSGAQVADAKRALAAAGAAAVWFVAMARATGGAAGPPSRPRVAIRHVSAPPAAVGVGVSYDHVNA